MVKNLCHDIRGLVFCLKIRHLGEIPLFPKKIHLREIFSAKLSPETGDSFALATASGSVQP
jgi:hypothetical protein